MNTYQEPCTDCLVGQSVLAYLGMEHLCTCIEMVYIRIQKMWHPVWSINLCVCVHVCVITFKIVDGGRGGWRERKFWYRYCSIAGQTELSV